jgi:glycosyltransferase involved in cell wall biosynthesis
VSVINIVVPPPQRRVFSGGIFCIFQYAKGLAARGHTVNVLPLLPSPAPAWMDGDYGRLFNRSALMPPLPAVRDSARSAFAARVRDTVTNAVMRWARFLPHEVQRGFNMRFVRQMMREADATVATAFETALPVHLHGTGRRCYFVQHFEPCFAPDLPDPKWAEHEALASYRLGLRMIANSSWLQRKLTELCGTAPLLCPNAIDHEIFRPEEPRARGEDAIRVISYGGRDASWKGFREMAEAVRSVRLALPHRQIRWLVYGDSLLPPRNPIAEYEPLGFLQPHALAHAYRSADILLSASWFESFPLFPLEAMACGVAVITTATGTEEFARHGHSAEIVEARDVASIAAGLRRLIEDRPYRETIARNGSEVAKQFRWQDAVERMEGALLG